jgi:hypothetical protein
MSKRCDITDGILRIFPLPIGVHRNPDARFRWRHFFGSSVIPSNTSLTNFSAGLLARRDRSLACSEVLRHV